MTKREGWNSAGPICSIGFLLVCFLDLTAARSSIDSREYRKFARVTQIQRYDVPENAPRNIATETTQIQSCLASTNAQVVFPGTSAYESARGQVFNHRNYYIPAGIVLATSVAHVQNAVNCAVKLGIGISPRSGGHSYEDYSLGGRDGVLVVDLGGLQQFSYDSIAGTAIVGAGFRLGPLKLALWNAGKVTVPSGNCASVGIGGHALGGGWGFVSRKFGLLSDNILEAQIVINNGSLIVANSEQNSDLLQALKGAGSNSFGIVVQFTFKVYDVSKPVTYFEYHYTKAQQSATTKAYQIWGLTAAEEISASLYHDPSGGNWFYGTFLGSQSSLQENVESFLTNVPTPDPFSTYIVETSYIKTVLINADFPIDADLSVLNLGNGYVYRQDVFKSKSILVKGSGFSDKGIATYIKALQAGPVNSYFIFDLFGGAESAINKISLKSGDGWVHRDSLFDIQMFAYWAEYPESAASEIAFIENIWTAVRPYSSSEAYQNYIDVEEPLSAYYGKNLPSLIATKNKWDSRNTFNFNQSIPLQSQHSTS